MVASAAQGLAVRCNPTTGKVDKHLLYSTDDGVPLHVNAVALDGQRTLWGFDAGYITMSLPGRSAGSRQLRVFSGFHHGAVTALALPSQLREVALSAGDDGTVRIWDVISATCAKTLMGVPSVSTCLEVTKDNRAIVGCADGAVVIWDIHVGQVVKDYRDQLRRQQPDAQERNPGTDVTAARRQIIYPPTRNINKPVHAIKHDAGAGAILVSYSDTPQVYKYNMITGECLGIFGADGHGASITAMEWDIVLPSEAVLLQTAMKLRTKIPINGGPSTVDGQTDMMDDPKAMRILATGDADGVICLWDGDDIRTDGEHIKPLRVLRGHTSPISALFVDGSKVVSGSDDGWIRVWEPLSGGLLNVLPNKLPRNFPADGTNVRATRVTNIHCNDYRGVATIGHQIKAWDFSPDSRTMDKRNGRLKNRSGGTANGLGPRQFHYEMKQDILESTESLKEERKEREMKAKAMDKLTLGGLSDEEMLAYAMMLSQEESTPSSGSSVSISSSSSSGGKSGTPPLYSLTENDYVQDDDEALMQAVIASLQVEEDARAEAVERIAAQVGDDEYDEELEYILKLSQTEQ
ncbi:WD40-repeat-containing domain protein [Dichotomocladium elegans]|nr:WD40-repeat-containing domain protein [Dichotomocladium elegans]